jgi:hypothetical protein
MSTLPTTVDMHLNVPLGESIIRGMIAIFLPYLFIAISPVLMILGAPVAAYLLVSALNHFCVIRYIYQRFVRHISRPDPWEEMDDAHEPVSPRGSR